jgi:hypothetical protein
MSLLTLTKKSPLGENLVGFAQQRRRGLQAADKNNGT